MALLHHWQEFLYLGFPSTDEITSLNQKRSPLIAGKNILSYLIRRLLIYLRVHRNAVVKQFGLKIFLNRNEIQLVREVKNNLFGDKTNHSDWTDKVGKNPGFCSNLFNLKQTCKMFPLPSSLTKDNVKADKPKIKHNPEDLI